ncbi:hypothetical protein JQ506_01705 [Shinella sp. PSBB067]|uniref:hypothetical protein n=1 Tax=Shinella sp. PSBB067 TaxID=2715959 RepID=UPI00193C3B30|nr:hypothetical protein [Shinella sp. PSBB067]QRI63758.1 hypothetical protein JQ506_01705 [Shinella sp. PSBB067]
MTKRRAMPPRSGHPFRIVGKSGSVRRCDYTASHHPIRKTEGSTDLVGERLHCFFA